MSDETTYKIIRNYWDETSPVNKSVQHRGLTLEQAQEWCKRDDTIARDDCGNVVWFDGYTEDK